MGIYSNTVSAKDGDNHVRTVVPKLARILATAFKADSIEGGCCLDCGMGRRRFHHQELDDFNLVSATDSTADRGSHTTGDDRRSTYSGTG